MTKFSNLFSLTILYDSTSSKIHSISIAINDIIVINLNAIIPIVINVIIVIVIIID